MASTAKNLMALMQSVSTSVAVVVAARRTAFRCWVFGLAREARPAAAKAAPATAALLLMRGPAG